VEVVLAILYVKGLGWHAVHMVLVSRCPLQCVTLTSDRARRVVLAVVDWAVRVVRAVVLIMIRGSIWLGESVRAECLRVGWKRLPATDQGQSLVE